MPKKAIYLVKELGAKSFKQVVQWLREVGYDVSAEGFGAMTQIDDGTIDKLRGLARGEQPSAPARKIPRVAHPTAEETTAPPTTARQRLKEFFATREVEQKEVTPSTPSAVSPSQTPQGPTATATRRLKSIIEERPERKVKLEKATPKEAAVAEKEAEVPELPPRKEKERAPTPLPKPRRRLRERRPSRLLRDLISQEDATIVSRKRVFKVKGARGSRPTTEVVRHLKITRPMTIRELSTASGIKVPDIIHFLLHDLDIAANINHLAPLDEITLILDHFQVDYELAPGEEPEHELEAFAHGELTDLQPRPPVVTIMGHVDHGKTKLLDAIRETHVMEQEAGGITQHIGAYQAEINGKTVTFIDTPGHEAFTAMRARGSQVTDIVVLVVAADDGVMPQTIEAIEHCKDAKVPIIVAVNKMDRPDANADRVLQQLSQHGLVPEEWGGDTVAVKISALKRQGLDELLDMILLQADLLELKADPTAPPFGVVIENEVDPGIGIVATVLVQQGTFEKGMYLLSGESVGRIKAMLDESGRPLGKAGPSTPARFIGFSEPPQNGDRVYGFKEKKKAQQIAEARISHREQEQLKLAAPRVSLEDVFARIREGEIKELKIVVKADVQGSAEAVRDALLKLAVEEAKVDVIRTGVGQVNETDVMLASASQAIIVGFNVGITANARKLAEHEGVQIRSYQIVYKLTEDIELALRGLLEPEIVEVPLGKVEIRAIFHRDRNSVVAGGMVVAGKAQRGASYRLKREDKLVFEGQLSSLKRFKEDVREVNEGYECGLRIEGCTDVQEGDALELYVHEKQESIDAAAHPSAVTET